MRHNSTRIKAKLSEFGMIVGLDDDEINSAKKTSMTIISGFIVTVMFALIGYVSCRLDAIGLWYGAFSIIDFPLFGHFL